MKNKLQFNSRLLLPIFVISIALIYSPPIFAQNPAGLKGDKLSLPAEEQFQKATDLIAPWRSSGCHKISDSIQEPNCHLVTAEEWKSSSVVTLYDINGAFWFRFSLNAESPEHFQRNTKMDFLPFATDS